MTAAPEQAAAHQIDPAALVLATRPLRAGIARAATARFRDGVWDLSPATHTRHTRRVALNFLALPAHWRPVAKELFYTMLTGRADGMATLHVGTVRSYFTAVKQFLAWLEARGVPTLAAVGWADLEAYQRHLFTQRCTGERRLLARRAVRLFWLCRSQLTADQLRVDPARLDGWPQVDRPSRGDNATRRIPEPVIGPLLAWALRWVADFADDILGAMDEWRVLHANTKRNRRQHRRPPAHGLQRRLTALLDRYRAERRHLPGLSPRHRQPKSRTDQVNRAHLARELGCVDASLREGSCAQLIIAAACELGVADDTYLRSPVRGRLDGRPWLPAIRYQELPGLVRQLQTACYILTAYLSGMRDSEVKHLRRGCLTVLRDNTGRPYRRRVTSTAFKGEAAPTGTEATWVVGEPVERAIQVLERLQPPNQPMLFALPPSSRHAARRRTPTVRTSNQTNDDLAAFVAWINDYCDTHGRPDRIPPVQGQPWHLTTGQFRRTLAWFIARRPGGAIAGAIAYRHQRVQMFEGYAGTSASGFRAEVEAEQALERGERLLAMVDGHEHQRLGGPAAEEAEARLAEFGRHAGFVGTVATDPRRVKLIMRRHDPNVFPGEFVTCVFNPDRALCLRPDADGRAPALADCKPLACRNVALTDDNLAAWQAHLAKLDQALAAIALAPYVRHRLDQQRQEISRFLLHAAVEAADPADGVPRAR
jgi:hypothetical protein